MAGGVVVIVGGAIIGSMSAYFLREQGFVGRIIVLERDPLYRFCSTTLSAASIRSQFGCAVNVRMSLFGAAFLKTLPQRFGPAAAIGFRERGYLILSDAERLEARHAAGAMQIENGASVVILSPDEIAARHPWLHVGGVAGGTLGTDNEGWFDAWSLLQLMRSEARKLGVEFHHAEAVGFDTRGARITGVRLAPGGAFAAGEVLAVDWVVNAAGPASGRVASWLGIPLPIGPRKRTVFFVKALLDGRAMPMLFDIGGVWIRPEGGGFICGIGPQGEDPDAEGDFEPDHALFETYVWPALAHRIPVMESLRVERAWAGHYEMNSLDHNGVIGLVDGFENFVIASGFSGHGVMHSPATGRGVAELIAHGGYRALDLTPLGYERVRAGRPMIETAIY